MTQNVPQNINEIPNSDLHLVDLLNYWKKSIKLEMNCHHVGTVQSFNSLNQTATATINYSKTFLQIDGVGASKVTTQDYPVLIDCPVICLGGGDGVLTFPITNGDECLILFNDRDMDNWFNGSSSSAPATTRLHAFSDALILVGPRSMSNVIVSYDTNAVTLKKGSNAVKIFDDKIVANVASGITLEIDETGKLKITNVTGEFVTALNQLFTDIQNALVNTMLGPQSLIMPTFPADLAVFQSFKT